MSEAGWSVSKDTLFNGCQREFAYHYFFSQLLEGADKDMAEQMKKLTSYAMEFGTVVHTCASDLAHAHAHRRTPPTCGQLDKRVRKRLNALYKSSKDLPGYAARPRRGFMVKEQFYGEEVQKGIEDVRAKLSPTVQALCESPVWEEVRRLGPERVVVIDKVTSVRHPKYGLIYVMPDLLLIDDDEWKITILDWKTGGTRGVYMQTLVYACCVSILMNVPPTAFDFTARVVSLSPYSEREYELTHEAVLIAEQQIANSISAINRKLSDVKRNIPLPLVHFPLRSEDNAKRCMNCRFFKLCEKELEREFAA